ncbi:MAG TPA: hypothetical protein PKD99_10875 [Sphingopyxis sp.]|nr:hypothetical protein [Sphingopyxis sp.]HMP45599.1 hypothetical protein [Sphingopyxis sp.]HMQ17939.1 hypothetical protein [Sphingopyxis sp.]
MTRMLFAGATGLALIAAVPVAASGPLPDGTTAEERANTARLNAEQRAKAEAETAAYEQQVAANAQAKASAEASYSQATAAYEEEKARVAALAAERRLKWEADVAACEAGDTTRCAPPPVPPQP